MSMKWAFVDYKLKKYSRKSQQRKSFSPYPVSHCWILKLWSLNKNHHFVKFPDFSFLNLNHSAFATTTPTFSRVYRKSYVNSVGQRKRRTYYKSWSEILDITHLLPVAYFRPTIEKNRGHLTSNLKELWTELSNTQQTVKDMQSSNQWFHPCPIRCLLKNQTNSSNDK